MSWSGRKLLVNFVTATQPQAPGGVMRSQRSEHGFQPPVDIYETAEDIVVRVEIAGMTADEINLALEENTRRLTISGVREDPASEEPRRYMNVEIECGKFMRVVQLPRPVVAEGTEAAYDAGFLVVRLPKRTETTTQARDVPIQ